MSGEKIVFDKKLFFGILILIHVAPYIVASFVMMDLITPIVSTFATAESRGIYIGSVLGLMLFLCPIYLPFEKK